MQLSLEKNVTLLCTSKTSLTHFQIVFISWLKCCRWLFLHKISLMHFNPKKNKNLILIYRNKANLILRVFCKLFLHSPSHSRVISSLEKLLLPFSVNEADLNYKTNFSMMIWIRESVFHCTTSSSPGELSLCINALLHSRNFFKNNIFLSVIWILHYMIIC